VQSIVSFLESVIIALNILAFLMMGLDKRLAAQHKRRLPERLLLLTALAGGSAGVWFGMKVFRHKTQHKEFYLGIPAVIAVHVLLLLYFTLRAG
jgi:uncharacterized membrane protein YsdA (DUF1294 family)